MTEFWHWVLPLLAGSVIALGPRLWDSFAKFWDPTRADRLSEQGWTRASSLETEIRSLRILLDRCRRRESAKDAVIGILLLALELGDELTEEAALAFISQAKATLQLSISAESK